MSTEEISGRGSAGDGERADLTRRDVIHRGLIGGAALAVPGLLAACGGAATSSGTPAGTSTTTQASGPVRRGGTFKVGMVGIGSSETLNPNLVNSDIDDARSFQVFEGFTGPDARGNIENVLVDEISPNHDATEWTIRLKEGVEFHNGKTLSAEDGIYTIQYNLNKKNGTLGSGQLATVDGNKLKKIDARTFRVGLTSPNAFFRDNLSDHHIKIFPAGTTGFQHPIGTGPFKFTSWVQGQRASYTRNPQYWMHGKPYLDGVEILSIADDEARINALQSGQVDAAQSIPLASIPVIRSSGNLTLLETESLYWIAQCMLTSGSGSAPCSDPRVRQALRLLVDRKQVVSNALQGHARLGNDMFNWNDAAYPHVPQREYDPEQAASLLKAAGQTNLTLNVYTSPIAIGLVQMSELMALSAKKAGVTLNVKQVPANNYFSGPYGKEPFFSTYWAGRAAYVVQAQETQLVGTGLNESRWNNPRYEKLLKQALGTLDRAKADELLQETQKILYESGGYIIPAFPNLIDGASTKVRGLGTSRIHSLGAYAWQSVSLNA